MQNFEVEVKPSCGGGFRRVLVQAKDTTDALVKATLVLGEAGIDRWELVRVVTTLN
jgi:hypothetical protein